VTANANAPWVGQIKSVTETEPGRIRVDSSVVDPRGPNGSEAAFDARAVGVSADWLPYVWRLSLILLALAAVTVYRVVLQGTAARIVALATLAAVAFIATPMATGSHVAEEQQSLILGIAVEGAKSPLILALIGAGVADLIARRQRTRAQ
jgi:hypothetical protein